MEHPKYPVTFLDYNIIVPAPGIIMFDEEINPDQLCVKNGDIFEAVVENGRLRFVGKSRKKD